MDWSPGFFDKSQIAREILGYLLEHPKAQDTLDGIVQWWLLEREINYQVSLVREALDDLVSKGLIVETKNRDMNSHYCINPKKDEEIKGYIRTSKGPNYLKENK